MAQGKRPIADAYLRFVRAIGFHGWFLVLGKHLLFRIDRFAQKLNRGWIDTVAPPGLPILRLTVKGRRSGRPHTHPVVYMQSDDRIIVVASNWGDKRHPLWSENLLADPEATVEIDQKKHSVRARLADSDEKRALWPKLLAVWPAWTAYERLSQRDLRVFVLEGLH